MFFQLESSNLGRKYFPHVQSGYQTEPPPRPLVDGDPFVVPCFLSFSNFQATGGGASCNAKAGIFRRLVNNHGTKKQAAMALDASVCSTSEAEGIVQQEHEKIAAGDDDDDKWNGKDVGRRKTTWGDMPKFLLAGAVSTIISRTCVAPLERIKLECMTRSTGAAWTTVVRTVWLAEGPGGFWKGNALNILRSVPFKCVNFICYDMYCDFLMSLPGKIGGLNNHDRLVGGGIAGITATVLCLPLDTIRTRLIAPGGDALGGVGGCVRHMLRNEGVRSFYRGLAPALIGMGPANAVFYAIYDALKSSHKPTGNEEGAAEPGVARSLLYGGIAGACAEAATYPLEVVRRHLQLQRSAQAGIVAMMTELVRRDGVGALFAGLIPSTLQVLPSASLSFFFYELMKSILGINN